MRPIPIAKLREAAGLSPESETLPPPNSIGVPSNHNHNGNNHNESGFNIQAFVERLTIKLDLKVSGPFANADGSRSWKPDSCPFQIGFNGGNPKILQSVDGKLGFSCHCGDHDRKHWSDLRTLVDGARERQQQHVAPGPIIGSIAEVPRVETFNIGQIRYIEDPAVVEAAFIALTGDAESGKSTLACAWAWRAHAAGYHVLILDRENPLSVIQDRFKRLGITTSPTFVVWGGWLPEEAPQPASEIVLSWVATCERKPVILIDSLSAFYLGSQNDAGEMRAFMGQCRRLADMGATPILIHHDGKAETAKDYRGSSDFKAAIDVGYHVSNCPAASDSRLLDKLIVRPYKSRFGLGGSLLYRYSEGKLLQDYQANAASETITEQLTSILRTNPRIGTKVFEALVNARGLGRERGREFLGAGVRAGTIRREGKRGVGYQYSLVVPPETSDAK